jgi:hypothetical protein
VSLPEELDAGNLHVQFCEGPGPTDIGLRSSGTAGKPGGQQRKQTSTYSIRRNRSTRLNSIILEGLMKKIDNMRPTMFRNRNGVNKLLWVTSILFFGLFRWAIGSQPFCGIQIADNSW